MTSYDASSITILDGPEAIRQNLNVYLNDLSSEGIFLAFREIIVNVFDEFDVGHGKEIHVVLDKSGFWVSDAARGIPVEVKPGQTKSTLTLVLTRLSAGGKMKQGGGYDKAVAGVHGMGSAITNAASTEFQVWTFRNGWYTQSFKKGHEQSKVIKSSAPKIPYYDKPRTKGTTIRFKPDYSCFDTGSKLEVSRVKEFLDLSSYLHPGLKIFLNVSGKETVYHQPNGLSAYLESHVKNTGLDTLSKPLIVPTGVASLALQWVNSDQEHAFSFVNGSLTKEGGTHVTGLTKAISEALAPFAGKRSKYRPEDVRVGLVYFLNAEVMTPKFTTQVKDKLRTPEAAGMVYEALKEPIKEFFEKNKGVAREIIKRACDFAKADEDNAARKRGIGKLKESKTQFGVPAKLMISTTKNPEERWLYLVEGDSVAGSCKEARDGYFQEILPLRGKILNVFGSGKNGRDLAKIYANTEIQAILKAVGYNKDNPGKYRVGRVIVAGDADQDGRHITTLVMSALYRLLPDMFEKGMIYKLDGKLFSCQDKKGHRYYGDTLADLKKEAGDKIDLSTVTRFKGWGEANPNHLIDLMFGETAKLEKITSIAGKDEKDYILLASSGSEEAALTHRKLLGITGKQMRFFKIDDESELVADSFTTDSYVFRFSRQFYKSMHSIRVR